MGCECIVSSKNKIRSYLIASFKDGDESVIYDASQALVTFQKLYGLFPRIVGKGDYSGVSPAVLDMKQSKCSTT